jgi:hypothetical protein
MTQPGTPPPESNGHWIFRRRTVNGAFWGLVLICALLGLIEVVYHRHTVFAFEGFPVAYGIFGFVSFVGIIFAGRGLRKVIMRDEDYYDR